MKTSEAKYREIRPVIESGQPEEAINQLHQLLDTHPDCAQGHSDLAALYHRNGDRDRAVHHYREAVRLDPENAATRKDLANYLYAELGETAEAFLHFRRVLELDPQEVETLLICGNLCVVEHRFEDARACYRKVLDIEPWNQSAREALDKLELDRKNSN